MNGRCTLQDWNGPCRSLVEVDQDWSDTMNANPGKGGKQTPPPVLSNDPEADLERELSEHPDDPDAKVDVGSDESMDASDPPAAAQPGQKDEPVPSSGFPEKQH